MDVLVERCAGLDVHRDTVVATVRSPGKRAGGRRSETRTFATHTAALVELSDWLVDQRVQLVAMESTGVYWKPVFYVLEERLTVWLVNAAHVRNTPGRKTDVSDSRWIAQCVECGLVSPSFVPPPEIRELRDYTRYRRALVEERTRNIQRLEKVLQDAGIKLSTVSSKVLTKSGRAMLNALMQGETDPVVLADLAKTRLRAKIPQLQQALAGRFRVAHHGPLVARILAHVDYLDESITDLDNHIDEMLRPFAQILARIITITGVNRITAAVLLAEIGTDMTVFATSGHLASWAGICPGNHASGGKRRSGKTRRGSTALRTALTEAAWAAARTRGTYLNAHYHQIRGRRGALKAIGALRHDILIAYWHIVHDNVDYQELGGDWFTRRHTVDHQRHRLIHQLEQLGYTVTLNHNTA
jgi:transposase